MDVFDLVAKIRLDSSEYESGIGKARGTFSTFASGVGKGLSTVAKIGAAAVSAGVAGVVALTKMGVEGYAQYEQLTGGVETLFRESSDAVMRYAENAYMTAGMSANQYMETVTSFSASLIQSLDGDTARAAQVADMAITDMSDNANRMGTDIGMIQNAYNGFAKGNFTMLDNLKLGYGGTREEMERLLADATAISGIEYDISSFSDISEAIHVIQTDMGITGTTAAEAAATIEGSLAMMGAAWQNLVVGMADSDADMGVLINNFVESTATAAQNLLPRIEQTLVGIGQLITALAPVIAEALPVLVESVLPSLLTAGVSLITALVQGVITALPALWTALLEAVQIILVEVFGVSEEKAGEFADGVNSFFTSIKDGFSAMVKSAQTDGTLLNQLWEGLKKAFDLVKNALSTAFDAVKNAFKKFTEQINTDGTWLNETWTGIQDAVQGLFDFVSQLFESISAAWQWCVEQINTEGTVLNAIWEGIKNAVSIVWEGIKTVISNAIEIIKGIFTAFTAILRGDWSAAWDAIKSVVSTVWDTIKTAISTAIDLIKTTISTAWETIKTVTSEVWDGIKTAISDVWDGIKTSVSDAIDGVKSTVSDVWESIKSTTSEVWEAIKTAIMTPIEDAWEVVSGVIENLKSAFDFEWSLPHLNLPHISVSGGVAPYGIGGKGSLPSFNIEWYKKAYDNAMVLSNPTIFGYSNGSFLGGGDGNGNEIVAGESHLMGMIGHVVESRTAAQNAQIVAVLVDILEAITGGNEEMTRAILADKTLAVGEREFARLVKTYA